MRFFLDNCLAPRHAHALNELLKPDHECVHLREKFPADTKDIAWITALAKEGDRIIISGDYRIGKNAHEKAAWHESKLTVFFLSKGWTNIPLLEQHSKLSAVFGQIIKHAEIAKPGSGFSISINNKLKSEYTP